MMMSFVSMFFRRQARVESDRTARPAGALKPRIEPLEERQVMTLTPVANPMAFPFSAVVNIVSLYRWTDASGPHRATVYGTGALVGPHDVLTVAHNIEHAGLPDPYLTLVFPGRNGLYNRPFGEAVVTAVHINPLYTKSTASGWNTAAEWDVAMLDLDRNIGTPQLADWLAFGWVSDDLLNQIVTTQDPIEVPGYPGGVPGNPAANGVAPFVDTGPIQYAPTLPAWLLYDRAQINTYQGDSGAPLIDNSPQWAYPTILGVQEAEFTLGTTNAGRAVRITQDKYNWLLSARNNDPLPVDRPQVMDKDNWFNTQTSNFTPAAAVKPGSNIAVNAKIWNGGTAKAGTFIVSFYLSKSPQITSSSIRLPGSVTVNSLGALKSATVTWKGKVPYGLAKGSYYVGWIIDPNSRLHGFTVTANAALGAPSQTGYVRGERLNVT
jgi:V8-like Glu-specific endopeptidase